MYFSNINLDPIVSVNPNVFSFSFKTTYYCVTIHILKVFKKNLWFTSDIVSTKSLFEVNVNNFDFLSQGQNFFLISEQVLHFVIHEVWKLLEIFASH